MLCRLGVDHKCETDAGWAQDVKARDRDETETLTSRDRDESETLASPAETRPRRDVKICSEVQF